MGPDRRMVFLPIWCPFLFGNTFRHNRQGGCIMAIVGIHLFVA
jgi:hypothetical protein